MGRFPARSWSRPNKKLVTGDQDRWRNPATKPFSRDDEIILKPTNLYRYRVYLVWVGCEDRFHV
jgi:hypothetical protein